MYVLERWVDDVEEKEEQVANVEDVEDVVKYNRVDCIALALLHCYMMQVYPAAFRKSYAT
jgi:hypothetical protein